MKYSKTIVRKLILGITALSLTTVCLVSTTFAWFAKNASAWTEDFEIKLHINEGLRISVDGETYYDSINEEQLKKAVALKKYNLINDNNLKYSELTDEIVSQYGKIELSPVSPTISDNGKFEFYGFETLDNGVTDISSFLDSSDNLYKPVNLTEEKKIKSYVEFDLYFRAITSSEDPSEAYDLAFVDENSPTNDSTKSPYIDTVPSNVKLTNKLTTYEDGSAKEYSANDEIILNARDAMRIAVIRPDNKVKVFEPYQGYASTAYINCPNEDKYKLNNPDINPMVTYFNNIHSFGNLYVRDYNDSYIETLKNFEGYESLGVFYKQSDGTYNDVKITMVIWLDGYDGDYIEGVDTKSMKCFLSFTKVGV